MPHQSNEALRKSLHIAFGLGAFALKWLPWPVAAAVAAVAVVANWAVLHRIVGKSVARHERGYDQGIVLYPIAVFALILVFRDHLHIAAIAWTTLAFGDGLATPMGRSLPIARLPWNREKSVGGLLAFIAAGSLGGIAVAQWLDAPVTISAIVIANVIAGIIETQKINIDDNLTVPFAAAVTLTVMAFQPAPAFQDRAPVWLGVNALLALAGYLMRSVSISGAVGGFLLGAVIIACAGWPLYVTLLAFFIIGTACTKAGYKRKERLGLAQEEGGRRGFSHAFSNVGVAAICALAFGGLTRTHGIADAPVVIYLMAIASLATAAADTTASEIGQWMGRRAFLPVKLQRVPVGTEGAISIEGTVAGLIAGAIVALIGALSFRRMFGSSIEFVWLATGIITVAAFIGSYLESIIGSWNRLQPEPITNGALNFVNTAAGALLVLIAWQIAV